VKTSPKNHSVITTIPRTCVYSFDLRAQRRVSMTFHCTVVIDIKVVMNATGCTRNLTDSAKKGNRKEIIKIQ
jgi:hypothetical protein